MSSTQDFQILLLQNNSEDVAVSMNGVLVPTIYTTLGFRVPVEFASITAPAGHTLLNTAPISFINMDEHLPADFIPTLPQGSREFFANQANLR